MDSDVEVAKQRLGEVLGGKWKLLSLIGTGGMAAVYAAQTTTGEHAAVKLLHPEISLKRDVRERFLREGYAANRVGHEGVVKVLEHGSSDNHTYLVMELLLGETLAQRVKRHGRLPAAEILDLLDQVLDVLVAAHDQGIVHRDLKPDNLFVTEQGRFKILDFGLARIADGGPRDFKTRTGMALGTLPYMAPEQALGRHDDIDGRADLFALGATAFRILSGRRVHEAPSEAELLMAMASKPAPALASVAPDVPADLCRVVDRALAFAKEARYPDARVMQSDVRAVQRGQGPPFALGKQQEQDEPTRVERSAASGVAASVAPNSTTAPLADVETTAPLVDPQRAMGRQGTMPLAAMPDLIQRPAAAVAAAVGGAPSADAPANAPSVPPSVYHPNATPAPGSLAASPSATSKGAPAVLLIAALAFLALIVGGGLLFVALYARDEPALPEATASQAPAGAVAPAPSPESTDSVEQQDAGEAGAADASGEAPNSTPPSSPPPAVTRVQPISTKTPTTKTPTPSATGTAKKVEPPVPASTSKPAPSSTKGPSVGKGNGKGKDKQHK